MKRTCRNAEADIPILRVYDTNGCDVEHVTAILQGASNSWFPVMLSALSVPHSTDKLTQLVTDNWVTLDKATSLEILQAFRQIGQLKEFAEYSDVDIWEAVQKKRSGGAPQDTDGFQLENHGMGDICPAEPHLQQP